MCSDERNVYVDENEDAVVCQKSADVRHIEALYQSRTGGKNLAIRR